MPHIVETAAAPPRALTSSPRASLPPVPAPPAIAPVAPSAAERARWYEPFDPGYLRDFGREVLAPISDHYFRPRLVGAERLPRDGPAILASNHSGNCLPYDGIVLAMLLWRREGMKASAMVRTVFEKGLTLAWWLRPCGMDNIYRRGGGVDMTFDNFERLLLGGERVLYFPEGVPGIGKGFQNRYRLQPFHTSFVTLALRHGVPVHPLYTVNAEWVMPYHFTIHALDRVMQRVFRVPFLPLPAGILAILWPWLWFLALPANMVFVVGEALDVRAIAREAGVATLENPTREEAGRVAERIRARMQAELDRHVAAYGKHAYDPRSLWRALRTAGRRIWRVLPTGWPVAFQRFDRDRARPPARSRLHAILRDWDLLAFYIP
ncbi:MAG TPA: 1-acyl-sn-glycerol-3-phosphate acyltransferase, partial [Gemmatimonadaceae bacterium]|nr:1-acyl-sn-glycerol-3-phosphate acyltransferase [Gemmatimonadaceae bacterium]